MLKADPIGAAADAAAPAPANDNVPAPVPRATRAASRARRNVLQVWVDATTLSDTEKLVLRRLAADANMVGEIKHGKAVKLDDVCRELGMEAEEFSFVLLTLRRQGLISKDWRSRRIEFDALRLRALKDDPDFAKKVNWDDIDVPRL